MENMEIWNAVKAPPATALKKIAGGRLKGMTDIKPQWRYQAMTENFGPCGIKWRYEIKKVWNEPGSDNQIFAFAMVDLFVTDQDGVWSEAIPGIGGSMLVVKESSGLHSSDEGYKMAVTDALSTAMQKIGVAADIYAGLWDGSKYRYADTPPPAAATKTNQTAKPTPNTNPVNADISTKTQNGKIFEAGKEAKLTTEETIQVVNFFKSGPNLTSTEADGLMDNFGSVVANWREVIKSFEDDIPV